MAGVALAGPLVGLAITAALCLVLPDLFTLHKAHDVCVAAEQALVVAIRV